MVYVCQKEYNQKFIEDNYLTLSNDKGSIPLYMQIKEFMIAKISNKQWLPSETIPSEMQLARDLEVSQGTVRKAITELVDNNVLIRKQGKGTFVANHDIQRALFHFFHITDNAGTKVIPQSKTISCRRKKASKNEAFKLQLKKGTTVICIDRIRMFDGKATMLETVILPAKLFATLDKDCELPNMLYELYERQFGITVHSANEQLRAVAASKREASLLNLPPKTPLIEIERIALTLNKKPIELRISHCYTKQHYYENTIF